MYCLLENSGIWGKFVTLSDYKNLTFSKAYPIFEGI